MTEETRHELVKKAMDMRKFSYTPYSHYRVGAALLTKNGKIYGGCNIENAAYTPANCGERTAFFKAISEGEKEFEAIAIVGGPESGVVDYCPPCGVCRQVMMEFCDPETFEIILAKNRDHVKTFTLKELLPLGFGPADLEK
ncbi:MAG: cytidine deaminase [Lachnospiraceae bacterium]|jgi:cytidine deaminase|nr:cytidine deaminase [Oribacterium sp.]MDY6315956.1 cytidine deaminase [Oribacterium sp.]MDY6342377.1 cytidine deaminase [Lachnospiraceae bacterium]